MNMEATLASQIALAQELLDDKREEWEGRYTQYASAVLSNTDKIVALRKTFRQWHPLYVYMAIGMAKGSADTVNLRYRGQEVANIKFKNDEIIIENSYKRDNEKYFALDFLPEREFLWHGKEAAQLRKHFSPTTLYSVKVIEHALESAFISELEKNKRANKDVHLHNVRPVKLANQCRFQMRTPFAASGAKLEYPKNGGGGIDLLGRVGKDASTSLCIFEIKQTTGRAYFNAAMIQATAYAVFIQELLASRCGREWCKIFGFASDKPLRNALKVCVVMPWNVEKNDVPPQIPSIDTRLGKLEFCHVLLNEDWENGISVKDTNILPQ